MTTHDLAQQLLNGPNVPLAARIERTKTVDSPPSEEHECAIDASIENVDEEAGVTLSAFIPNVEMGTYSVWC